MTDTEAQKQGTQSHDPDFPEQFRQFMRTGWGQTDLEVAPRPEAPNHAKRRARLAEAFPGEVLVIPSGGEMSVPMTRRTPSDRAAMSYG